MILIQTYVTKFPLKSHIVRIAEPSYPPVDPNPLKSEEPLDLILGGCSVNAEKQEAAAHEVGD